MAVNWDKNPEDKQNEAFAQGKMRADDGPVKKGKYGGLNSAEGCPRNPGLEHQDQDPFEGEDR